MKNERMNRHDNSRRVLTYFGSLCLGLAVFAGTASLGAKEESSSVASAGDSTGVLSARGISSTDSSSTDSSLADAGGDTATTTDDDQGRQRKAAPTPGQQDQGDTDPSAAERADQDSVMHVGRVIGSIPVVSKSGQPAISRAAGELGLGDPCSCDQDCAAVGDQCNLVQCIVRSICTGDPTVPCTSNVDCAAVGAGTCTTDPANCDTNEPPNCSFVQRCDTVQLVGWPCDADADFCTQDQCVDDDTDTDHSICVEELDGIDGKLSPCAKQCAGGSSNGRRCGQASDCPNGSCQITGGGFCDSATAACYVGPNNVEDAIGRCCSTGGACTETTKTTCTGGGGAWYRYRNPEDLEGDGNCLCPKYGSGVAPSGDDLNTVGLVRPSGLICHAGSVQTNVMVYCEDIDGDGIAINFCQKRCAGGDNDRQPCENDKPDCAFLGTCSVGGTICLVENNGEDCGLCEGLVDVGCDNEFNQCPGGETCLFEGGQTCPPSNPGICQEDQCISNNIEGGCEDGFLNIGDDYSIVNGSFLRLSQFRFRGGISNLAEDFVIEFWNAEGTRLVDAFAVNNLGRTGTFDWTIEVDCFPNCNPGQLEVAEQNPIILPPTGYVVMRSPRTVGTINGAAAFWSQTDHPADVGLNDDTKAWVNGNPNGTLGTNVFIFELVGSKVPDPLGACCDDAETCEDTTRWRCGLCTQKGVCLGGFADGTSCEFDADPADCEIESTCSVSGDPCDPADPNCPGMETCDSDPDPGVCAPIHCSNTLNDCPRGGEAGSFCQFNRWFGPISHDDFLGGGADLTLCGGEDGLAPCNAGACCDGSSCTVTKEEDCLNLGLDYRGIATDCTPNCCPVDVVTGSDCACITKTCVETALSCLGGADAGSACDTDADCALTDAEDRGECGNLNLASSCDSDLDCEAGIATCVLQCEPVGVTQHRHPYGCIDDIGSPLEPAQACDPANGNADCPPISCTVEGDCPFGMACVGNICEDTTDMTCEQSFTTSFAIVRNDTIDPLDTLFIAEDGDGCSLNSAQDRVGWFELVNLVDPTPGFCNGDGVTPCDTNTDNADCDQVGGPCVGDDDCFILTMGLCCTDPILTPVWPFLSQFINCPCVQSSDVFGIPPDFDLSNDQKAGFGANSKANLAGRCEDGNYSATFTVPPGEYAYQINADTFCVASITPCLEDDDCPGTSCVVPNPNYSVVFTVESCQIAACCVEETCILTNELDCTKLDGNFLGGGDQPVVTCQTDACILGSCCLDGVCKDDEFSNTKDQCEADQGAYFGGVTCDSNPCPACPFDSVSNCQQVQTIFGSGDLAWIDRNPANAGDGAFGRVLADDVQFAGGVVDEICWNTWFLGTGGRCAQSVDTTWEIRVYDTDPDCPGLPGTQLGFSTITVLNKIEGAGQGSATWHYSGTLDDAITLTGSPGVPGDTYWFEVSCFGEDPCGCRAAWSRDQGNENSIKTDIEFPNSLRIYDGSQVSSIDMGFCENTGIGAPPTVLGTCCLCADPCQEDLSQLDCNLLGGVWRPCSSCAEANCSLTPANDDCGSPFLVSNVPVSADGSANIEIAGENFCAIDDGPLLDATPEGQCAGVFNQIHDDVWYAYTAEACGDLTIESCGTADNDQIIVVYNGSVPCPVTDADELTCGDDTCGPIAGPGTVTLPVFEGQELLIRIGGWNNEVPGGFDGNPRGNWTARWSITACTASVGELLRAASPHDILKNRYISVDPRGVNGDNPPNLHISLEVESSEVNGLLGSGPWWASDPVDGGGLSPAVCISVVTTTKPASPPDWSGCTAVHLTGCGIVPTTTYSIVAESAAGESSTAVLLDTQAKPGVKWHGDTVGFFNGVIWTPPNGTTSIDDAVAAIKTFQDPSAFNATHLSVSDVSPNLDGAEPNLIVSIADVFVIILGFQGLEYPGPDLTQCP